MIVHSVFFIILEPPSYVKLFGPDMNSKCPVSLDIESKIC